LEYFKDMPWVEEAIRVTVKVRPWSVMYCADLLKDMPWGWEVIEKAAIALAEKNPVNLLSSEIRHFKDRPCAMEIMRKAATKYPREVLMYAYQYIDAPWAMEAIEMALELSEDPLSALEEATEYATKTWNPKPWPDEILAKARAKIESLKKQGKVETNPVGLLSEIRHFKDGPCAMEILRKAATKDPRGALLYAYEHIDAPWAMEVIEVALESSKDPLSALEEATEYATKTWNPKPWPDEILAKAKAKIESLKKQGK
jgi:hypothetical protein